MYLLELIALAVLHDVLQEDVEEEDLELCGDFRWRTGVDLHEDADVLLEGHELRLELVIVGREVVHLVEFLAGSLDEAPHEDVEGVLAMQLLAQLCQL